MLQLYEARYILDRSDHDKMVSVLEERSMIKITKAYYLSDIEEGLFLFVSTEEDKTDDFFWAVEPEKTWEKSDKHHYAWKIK